MKMTEEEIKQKRDEIAENSINREDFNNFYAELRIHYVKYGFDQGYQLAQAEIKELEAKLEIAVEALKEASEYSNTDDCNGFAGEIAKEALKKLRGKR